MNNSDKELVNFAIGLPQKMEYGKEQMDTGICKDEVEESFLTKEGFRGDGVADLKNHGGQDRAVCLYPYEHYSFWEEEFGTSLPSSAFGENLTVTNMLERNVYIGDIYRLGESVIQITQGRIPCSTITKRTSIQSLLSRIVETGYTGFFARVLEEGNVEKDSTITLIQPHPKKVSVLYGNQVYFHNRQNVQRIRKILAVQELAEDWKEKLERMLKKLT